MTEKIDLKEIQRSVYRARFQDGLWDITLGVIVLAMGLNPWLAEIGFPKPFDYLLLPLLGIMISFLGKQRITNPRMSSVRFGEQGIPATRKMWLFAALIIPIQIVLIILIRADITPQLQAYSGPLVSAAAFTLIAAIISRMIEFSRLSVYGVMVGIGILAAEYLFQKVGSPLDGLIPFSFIGILIIINGTLLLGRFLRTYPGPQEVDDVS